MRTLELTIETIEVKAKPRRLERRVVARKGKKKFVYKKPWRWTCEPLQPMTFCYSKDIEDELTAALMSHF